MAKLRPMYNYSEGGRRLKGYYAEFYDPNRRPKQKRHSLRTKNKEVARQKLAELERKEAMDLFDPWEDRLAEEGVTAQRAVDLFIKSREKYCAESTVETYSYVLNAFVRDLPPGFPLYGVRREHVKKYLDGLDLADPTRASYLDRLRIFFAWCAEKGHAKSNPVPDKVSRGKKSRMESVPEFLTEEEFGRLIRGIEADAKMKNLTHGNRWLLDVVQFAVNTGLRRGEIIHLRWGAIDWSSGMVRVENTDEFTTKSGRERPVPLVEKTRGLLEHIREERDSVSSKGLVFRAATGGKINGNYLSKRFRYYRRLAKLPENISFHSLRHTFASWFVLRGGDLYRLKEILGHADMKTTLKYAHLRPDALRYEMQKTFGRAYEERQSELERLRRKLEDARAELSQAEERAAS